MQTDVQMDRYMHLYVDAMVYDSIAIVFHEQDEHWLLALLSSGHGATSLLSMPRFMYSVQNQGCLAVGLVKRMEKGMLYETLCA